MTQRGLFISDIHVGSYWGPVLEDTKFRDTRTGDIIYVEPSSLNIFITDHWHEMERKCRNVDFIVINGDAVDGINNHNHGAVYSDDVCVQIEHFCNLYEGLPQDVPTYITHGTDFHSGYEIVAERIIADKIGATYGDELVIDECGHRIFANHFIPHAKNMAAAVERKVLEFAGYHEYYHNADILNFAHNHKFSCVMTTEYLAFVNPCWQGKTSYAAGKNLIAPSDIGWLVLNIHDEDCMSLDRSGITRQPSLCRIVGNDK